MKYRKKPVVIEAFQYTKSTVYSDMPRWAQVASDNQDIAMLPGDERLYVTTLEGQMTARPGDWIIQGVNGELYPCKPDIFAATYEAVP